MNTGQAPPCALALYISIYCYRQLPCWRSRKDFSCRAHFLEVDLSQYIENSQSE